MAAKYMLISSLVPCWNGYTKLRSPSLVGLKQSAPGTGLIFMSALLVYPATRHLGRRYRLLGSNMEPFLLCYINMGSIV